MKINELSTQIVLAAFITCAGCASAVADEYWNDLRHAYFELAHCYSAAGRPAEAASALRDLLNALRQIEARRSLRADEMESRKSALAKMEAWRGK